jgi:hypothetical protein
MTPMLQQSTSGPYPPAFCSSTVHKKNYHPTYRRPVPGVYVCMHIHIDSHTHTHTFRSNVSGGTARSRHWTVSFFTAIHYLGQTEIGYFDYLYVYYVCIYMNICVYIYMNIHVYIYTCVYIYGYTCVYIYI